MVFGKNIERQLCKVVENAMRKKRMEEDEDLRRMDQELCSLAEEMRILSQEMHNLIISEVNLEVVPELEPEPEVEVIPEVHPEVAVDNAELLLHYPHLAGA